MHFLKQLFRFLPGKSSQPFRPAVPFQPKLDRLEERLLQAGAQVKRYKKPTFTKPAPVDLRHEIAANCTLVIEALAD